MNMTPFADLIHWANIVDGAKYESAEAAVEMRAPAMQLTMVIESVPGDSFVPRVIPLLTEMSLQEGLGSPWRSCGGGRAGAGGRRPNPTA